MEVVDGRKKYLHRLNFASFGHMESRGGWVEHYEDDTYFSIESCPPPYPIAWKYYPVDFPAFWSQYAVLYNDEEIGGLKKGNVYVKYH
jgi:hypothetical protein